MSSPRFKGVIFDMDGVLVDSEKLYLRFWKEACASFGFELTSEQALSLRSNSPETAIPKFLTWFGEAADYHAIRERRRKMMAEYIDAFGVELKPGASETVDWLKNKGIKLALATASPVRRAMYYLAPHGIFDVFDAVVSGEDVARSKPAPDIYLRASHALGLKTHECIAAEDSPSGILSAKDAGCFTVMIPDLTLPEDELLPQIDFLAQRLTDITGLI